MHSQRRPRALNLSLDNNNPILQPPHSAGTPLSGLRTKLDPAQIPSVVSVHYKDEERWLTQSYMSVSDDIVPLSTTEYHAIDQGNSTPRFLRPTVYAIPATSDLANKCKVPIGLHIQPFAQQPPEESPIPVINFGDLDTPRCSHCRGYINPWIRWESGGMRWLCNLCDHPNNVQSDYYSAIDSTMRRVDHVNRPELNVGTVDFIVPEAYWAPNPPKRLIHSFTSVEPPAPEDSTRAPGPMNYVFVIDCSYESVQVGLLKSACSILLDILYGSTPSIWSDESKVAIVTFDQTLHFYDLSPHLDQASILVVPEIDDVFCPLREGLLVKPSTSRHILERLLQELPDLYQENICPQAALGSALAAGLSVLNQTGGHIIAFQSCLPVIGNGMLTDVGTESSLYGTENENTLYKSRDPFWRELGEECVDHGVGVTLILTPSRYIDVGTIGVVPAITGGETIVHARYDPERDEPLLSSQIRRVLSRETAYQCAIRVRCSAGLRVKNHFGAFRERTNTDLECGIMDADKSIYAQIEHTGSLDPKVPAYFQAAVLYTTIEGERRVRVCNISLPVVELAGNIFRYGDLDGVTAAYAKMAVTQLPVKSRRDIREGLTVQCAELLLRYRMYCAASGPPGQLVLPQAFNVLPAYVNGIIKSKALKGTVVVSDVRNQFARSILSKPVHATIRSIYPRLYQLHDGSDTMGTFDEQTGRLQMPPLLRSTYTWMQGQGVYFIDDGEVIILWLGADTEEQLLQDLFGESSTHQITRLPFRLPSRDNSFSDRVKTILAYLEQESGVKRRFLIARQNLDGTELDFANMLAEDTNNDGMSYLDYLCYIHRLIFTALSEGHSGIHAGSGTKWIPW